MKVLSKAVLLTNGYTQALPFARTRVFWGDKSPDAASPTVKPPEASSRAEEPLLL